MSKLKYLSNWWNHTQLRIYIYCVLFIDLIKQLKLMRLKKIMIEMRKINNVFYELIKMPTIPTKKNTIIIKSI